MDKKILKESLLKGALTGVATWLVYGLVFQVLVDRKPVSEALFSTSNIIFLVVITVAEIFAYYFTLSRKKDK